MVLGCPQRRLRVDEGYCGLRDAGDGEEKWGGGGIVLLRWGA